jgi:hypothetical protein
MAEAYMRYSRLTGKKYNVFDCARIYNLGQSIAYMRNGVLPVDIKIGENREGVPILVFYFIKEETEIVYDLWLKHEL